MIVFKNNKGFQIRSDKPYENWTEEDCYVVEDNTVLANKIILAYPYYNFITDSDDSLIDIEVLEKPEIIEEPTIEERLTTAEDTLNFLLGL